VDPLLKPEDIEWANGEIERQKAERRNKKNPEAQSGAEGNGSMQTEDRQAPRRRRKQG